MQHQPYPPSKAARRWASFVALSWYDDLISFVFRFVAKTSEPLLAAGVIVSAADFLQKGALMAHNQELASAWSWTQALAIEASTGPVLVFALSAFRGRDKLKGVLYAVLAALLFVVGGAMLLLQLISNAGGLSEASLNVVVLYALFTLRVIVSAGMIALSCTKHMRFSGGLSEVAQATPAQAAAAQEAPALHALDVATLVNELDSRLERRLEQRIEAVLTQVRVTLEQSARWTQDGTALASPPGAARLSEASPASRQAGLANDASPCEQDSPAQAALANDGFICRTDSEQASIVLERFQSKEQAVREAVARRPGATAEEIASEVGCSARTAAKWMQHLQGESEP